MKHYSLTHHPQWRLSWCLLLGLLLFAFRVQAQQVVYAAPITITAGGTYEGNWYSDNPSIPAVSIRTTAPVIIQNSRLKGKGDLIRTVGDIMVNVTIRNCYGEGMNPGEEGKIPGRFLRAEKLVNLVLENNTLVSTSGIYLLEFRGDATQGHSIKILRNRAKNIDGRRSNGPAGGWQNFQYRKNKATGQEQWGYENVQFAQFDKVKGVVNCEIAWNEVINEPFQSRVEDNINIYMSRGTAASPILIHNNYIQGGYNIQPNQTVEYTSDATYTYRWNYAGGGIMLGDGGNHLVESDVSAYVKAYNNQVVSTTNYGIAIARGHDLSYYNNRAVSCGKLPDGRDVGQQNVGIYLYSNAGGTPEDRVYFYNNSAYNNVVGWRKLGNYQDRNDTYLVEAQCSNCDGNTSLPSTMGCEAEAAELSAWRTKTQTIALGATIGPDLPVVGIANGVYRLEVKGSNQRLSVANSSLADGGQVIVQGHSTALNQQWEITAVGNGYYKLRAMHTTNKVLAVTNASPDNGALMQQYTDNGSTAQRWRINAASTGYHWLQAECSGKAMEVQGVLNSVQVQQWTYANGAGDNQQWKLVPVTTTPPTPASNLVLNPGFELDNMDTQTPRNWLTWAGTDGTGADADKAESYGGSHSGNYHGTHAKSSAYEVYTYQLIQNLPNGLYTLRAWVKCGGGQEYKQMGVKHYGGVDRAATIPQTYNGAWALVELTDINVTNGQCEVAFYSKAAANQWLYFDDVEFRQQSTAVTTASSVSAAKASAEGTASSQLELYPNPAQDQVMVHSSFAQAQEVEVTILTAQGKKAASSRYQVPAGASHFSVPTRALPAGLYLLQVQDGERRQTQRLVVTH